MRNRLTLILLAVAGAASAAAPPAPPLADATTAQVKARLGEPAVASGVGKGALWTYRFESCALMVFFKDEGRGLRVSGLTASPRKREAAQPEVAACVAEGSK